MEVELLTEQKYRDWTATVKLEEYALGGSGKVVFFLATKEAIPTDPRLWFGTPSLVVRYICRQPIKLRQYQLLGARTEQISNWWNRPLDKSVGKTRLPSHRSRTGKLATVILTLEALRFQGE